jgi:Rrf2 family protein
MLSQTAEYALRAVLAIAQHERLPVRAAQLAATLSIPANYLSKTLHQLARDGVLSSSRGKLGGFTLARPPSRIRLLDVVGSIDGLTDSRTCLLGRPVCSDQTACVAHERWKEVSDRAVAFFRETTVADLVPGVGKGREQRDNGERGTGNGK